ncbi:MAG: polysaccharide deacetylase family protein [Ruegeria sp.]
MTLRSVALRGKPTLILCYHTLGPDTEVMDAWTVARVSDFQQQIQVLRQHFEIVSLIDALNPILPVSKPRAVITFDDGERGLFTHLLPIVQDQELPVTVYIATAQVESGQAYWFDRIMNALQNPGVTEIRLDIDGPRHWVVGPETGVSRWMAISDILETLKLVSPSEREELTQSVLLQAGPSKLEATPLAPLTIEQLKSLADSPLVTIGAHSHCHNLLDQISLEQADDSIRHSRALLQKWTGRSVDHFAYPNGNHNPELHRLVKAAGFASATVLGQSLCPQRQDNAFALPRVLVGRYDSLARLRLRFIGL